MCPLKLIFLLGKIGQNVNKFKKMRLDKFLSILGFGSRKKVSQLIKSGKIKVNSNLIKDPSFKINPEKDKIEVNGKILNFKNTYFYYKFYKPKGYITSTKDLQPTIMRFIPENLPGFKKIFPVGRLDKDSEGLLILTNDGALAHRILHPKWKLPKTYEIKIIPPIKEKDKELIEKGVELSDGKTLPCKIIPLNKEGNFLKIIVYEGRYHLLKRMFGKLGYKISYIKRLSIGPIFLEDLSPGEVKAISSEEIQKIKKLLNLY